LGSWTPAFSIAVYDWNITAALLVETARSTQMQFSDREPKEHAVLLCTLTFSWPEWRKTASWDSKQLSGWA
jgi:hypothetical protein